MKAKLLLFQVVFLQRSRMSAAGSCSQCVCHLLTLFRHLCHSQVNHFYVVKSRCVSCFSSNAFFSGVLFFALGSSYQKDFVWVWSVSWSSDFVLFKL